MASDTSPSSSSGYMAKRSRVSCGTSDAARVSSAHRFADSPHEHDVRPEHLELRDSRRRDLLDGRRGRESCRVPLQELGLPARVALALEERSALERTTELLGDRVQHPPLRLEQLAVLPERDADGADRARERNDVHRLDAGQQLLHVGRVQLPHTVAAVELHRLPRAHDVGSRRRGRERHGPPAPVLAAQARGNLQRPHVVARSDTDGAQRRVEGLEEERDAGFGHLCRKRGRREARDEPLQDVSSMPPFVVDRAEPGALERDAALLCDPDDDGSRIGIEPVGLPRAREQRSDGSVSTEQRNREHRRETGAVGVHLRRLHDDLPVRIASSASACAAPTSSGGPTAASVSTASPRRMRTAATSIPAPARSATVEAATSRGLAAAARCEAFRSSSSDRSRAARSASWACLRRRSEEVRDTVNAASMTERIAPPTRIASDEECDASAPLAVTTHRRPPSVSDRVLPPDGGVPVEYASVPPTLRRTRSSGGRRPSTLEITRMLNQALT